MTNAWKSPAARGAYVGASLGLIAAWLPNLYNLLLPGTAIAYLTVGAGGLLSGSVLVLANAVACGAIWAGICASGKFRWLARAGAVVAYFGLVLLGLAAMADRI